MSDQSSSTLAEALTPETSDETRRRLVRMLDFAAPGRFVLGFARCNLPVQRRALVERLGVMLDPLGVTLLEVELSSPVDRLLPILKERLAGMYSRPESPAPATPAQELAGALAVREDQSKVTIFVYGLEHSLPSIAPYPPLLDHLNMARELFRREVPCPLVLWLPDYALTKLARGAPDFWAWRSGVYEFPAEPEIAARVADLTVYAEAGHVTSSLSAEAKRERLHMLVRLLEDYRELGDGPRERGTQADILWKMGNVQQDLGEWADAGKRYEEALTLVRTLEDPRTEAGLLHQLATLKQAMGALAEARRLYDQSLQLARVLGDRQMAAITVHNLGVIAHNQGDSQTAQKNYQQALATFEELGDKRNAASALHQLGRLALDIGDPPKANRLYNQSLGLRRKLGDKQGSAQTLHQLGRLAQDTGNLAEARRLFDQSLQLKRELGDKRSVATTLHQLGRLAQDTGDLAEARRLYDDAGRIFDELGAKREQAVVLHQLGRLAQDTGNLAEARRLYEQSLQSKREIGDKQGIAASLAQIALLEKQEGNFSAAIELTREAEALMIELGKPENVARIREQRERLEGLAADGVAD